jgi:molecular chaperone DnaJ
MSKDYYKTLGVEKGASQDEIKKAFRKKAHKLHPDKEGGDEVKFKEANEAYQVLSDETKRSQYDQYGSNFEQQGGFGGGMNWEDVMNATRGQGGFGGMDFGDIFGDMFGGGGRGRRQRKGSDIQVDIEIDFADVIKGVEKEVSLRKQNACDVCDGSGGEPGTAMETCKTCDGRGQVMRVQRTILGAMQTAATCSDCAGQGTFPKDKCKHCDGTGTLHNESTYTVKIPAGISSGQSIRLTGKGAHAGTGSVSGDLYVRVHVKHDDRFERRGNDIHSEASITYPQAVNGDKIKIATVEGEKTLVIPAGTQSHQDFRLKGLGFPSVHGGGRGNQYVKIIVDVPKKASKKVKKILQELQEEL